MRFSSTLLAVAAALVVPALALDPNNCNTSDKKRDGADFILVEQADNANVASLAKVLKRVSVASVFKDGNHKMTTDSAGRKLWEKKSGFDDEDTDKWVPQGISSTADALDAGTYEGVDGWVVSWHRSDDKSARITFVNRSNDTYRHALLVYPHAADNFREVPIHAGGILWFGDKLWIVDTSNGIRVFDLANIWQVDTGDAVGKSGDKYTAAGYRYVVPQIRSVGLVNQLAVPPTMAICLPAADGTSGRRPSPSASRTCRSTRRCRRRRSWWASTRQALPCPFAWPSST
jgi:hypothetical protein